MNLNKKPVKRYRQFLPGKRGHIHWTVKQRLWAMPCSMCGITSREVSDSPGKGMHIDHILPISKGGTDDESNLQTLCWYCNTRKGNRN